MKKIVIFSVLGLLLVGLLSYLYQMGEPETYDVMIVNNNGNEIGKIRFSETKAGVLLGVNIRGLKPSGEHAIHIHEKGDCTPVETFENAGGHFNPKGKSHGLKHPEGAHAGDMPNLEPDEKGVIVTQIMNRKITLSPIFEDEKRAYIFDKDGASIVIHDGADDHMSQPSGASGARIACGVIKSK